jgi:hypothetical protein
VAQFYRQLRPTALPCTVSYAFLAALLGFGVASIQRRDAQGMLRDSTTRRTHWLLIGGWGVNPQNIFRESVEENEREERGERDR